MPLPIPNEICKHKIIADFIALQNTANTKMLYKAALKNYFDFLGVVPEKYIKEMRTLPKAKKLKAMDTYTNDLIRYANYLKSSKAPKTSASYFSIARTFLRLNHIELDEIKIEKISKNAEKPYEITIEKPLTTEILSRLFDHSRGVIEKAFFLTLASSGIRLGEALQLQPEDFDFSSSPKKINIIHDPRNGRTTKTKCSRVTFISEEASRCVQAWLKEKDAYIKTACGKNSIHQKDPNDKRAFPFSTEKVYRMWDRLCIKAGIYEKDKRTGINVYRVHMLRKFFNTQMKTVIPEPIVEKLMGHAGYLNGTYDKYTLDQLANFYHQGMSTVTIFERKYHDKETQKELDSLRELIKQLFEGEELEKQVLENLKLEEQKPVLYQQYKQQLFEEEQAILASNPPSPIIKS